MHALTYRVERIALAGLEQGVLSWAIEEMWRIGCVHCFQHHICTLAPCVPSQPSTVPAAFVMVIDEVASHGWLTGPGQQPISISKQISKRISISIAQMDLIREAVV